MRCDKCGAEGIPGKFCAECGARLSNRCPKCGSDGAPSAKFCADCGALLAVRAGAVAKTSADPQIRATDGPFAETPEGERKIVTVLFADIKGSMELIEDLDPEEARNTIVDPALKLMIDAVHHYGGYSPRPG
jgi:Double zinc ribbon